MSVNSNKTIVTSMGPVIAEVIDNEDGGIYPIITGKNFRMLERMVKIQSITIELLEERIKKLEEICQTDKKK
jgi:ABC-type branched-subunit amino acid transport system ATPase component